MSCLQFWYRRFRRAGLTLVGLCLTAALAPAQSRPQVVPERLCGEVRVLLKPTANVTQRVVRLADVAAVEGGDPRLRELIANTDLDEPPRGGQSTSISPKFVEFRLQLAGIDSHLFQVRGKAVTVTSVAAEVWRAEGPAIKPHELSHEVLLEAARQAVLRRLPWDPADIEIRLAQKLADVGPVSLSAKAILLNTELRTAWPPLGRVQVGVIVSVDGRPHSEVPVYLEVRHLGDVVVSKKPLEANQTISPEDLYVDRRELEESGGCFSTLQSLVGQRTRRAVRPLTVIGNDDVTRNDASQSLELPVLIKRQDRVRLVGQTSALSVSVLGEALQDGRVGELIRLRNVDSQRIIMGRVVSANEAKVQF